VVTAVECKFDGDITASQAPGGKGKLFCKAILGKRGEVKPDENHRLREKS